MTPRKRNTKTIQNATHKSYKHNDSCPHTTNKKLKPAYNNVFSCKDIQNINLLQARLHRAGRCIANRKEARKRVRKPNQGHDFVIAFLEKLKAECMKKLMNPTVKRIRF